MNKEENLIKLGNELKKLRKERGLSLVEVGEQVNLSHNFLSEVERGKKEPSDDSLRALSKCYEIDEDELFKILSKIPLRTKEYVKEDPYLQKLLSKVQKKYEEKPDKIERVREKIIKIYEDFLEEE